MEKLFSDSSNKHGLKFIDPLKKRALSARIERRLEIERKASTFQFEDFRTYRDCLLKDGYSSMRAELEGNEFRYLTFIDIQISDNK